MRASKRTRTVTAVIVVGAIALVTATTTSWASLTPDLPELDIIQSADQIFEKHLEEIQSKIDQKKYLDAVYLAIRKFDLDDSACKGFEVHKITSTDENGNALLARTPLTQTVAIDPEAGAFKTAKFLVSTLAHEITHCHQHEKLYLQAVQSDAALEPLKKANVLELRVLSDLDELSSVAETSGPLQAQAQEKFKNRAEKLGLKLSAAEFIALAKTAAKDIQSYAEKMGPLTEMQAIEASFEVPGLLESKDSASEEYRFHMRALEKETQLFIRGRKLLGANEDIYCRLSNAVPFSLTVSAERTCLEAFMRLSLLETSSASK